MGKLKKEMLAEQSNIEDSSDDGNSIFECSGVGDNVSNSDYKVDIDGNLKNHRKP